MKDISTQFAAIRASERPASDPLDHFGRCDWGYDHGYEPDGDEEQTDFGDGAPGKMLVRDCLVTWAKLWNLYDIFTAAAAFHIDPALINPLKLTPEEYQCLEPDDNEFSNCVQLMSSQRCYCDPDAKTPEERFVEPTVAEIAALLNSTEVRVINAVNNHFYMLLGAERDGSPAIEHDGE